MKIETYEQRIVTPEAGHFLYNENAKTFSDKVYLGVNADVSEWVEVTEEEKVEIEASWEEM